jgi:beta-lactamase class A
VASTNERAEPPVLSCALAHTCRSAAQLPLLHSPGLPRLAWLGVLLALVGLIAPLGATASFADPTPAPLVAGSSLTADLDRLLQDQQGSYGVLVEAQASGERYEHQADDVFRSASVYKLPLAIEVLRRVDRHQLDLDDQLTIADEDATEGEPLGGVYPGDTITVQQALTLITGVSSNAAAHALMRLIGRSELDQSWSRLGWHATLVPRAESSDDSSDAPAAVTSAADMADLFDRLLRGQLLTVTNSLRLLQLLSAPDQLDPIGPALPEGTAHVGKTGNLDDASTVASVVYTPTGPLIVVVLDQGVEPASARAVIGTVVATVYPAVSVGP